MRNLKRVLSLVLASIMLIGMMVVGAGAVDTYNDFSDKDEIVNKDAVSLLVTLGVINGKEDGSHFDPTGDVTRAEMAKMISVILNQGADINSQYAGMDSGLTDTASNWAVGHINYCYTLGIIAGRGNNTFDPTANVTATEAAKMLLTAAGYDASIEGLVGPNWNFNTAALASKLGIFHDYNGDIAAPLSRDNAALLIYNFLDIEMILKYEDGYAIPYDDNRTILAFAYGVIKVQGVVTANEWAALDNDVDTSLLAGKTRIENANGILSTTTSTAAGSGEGVVTGTFNVSTPVDMLGRNVTMYIKKTTVLADSIVYGQPVLNDLNTVVVNGSTKTVDGAAKLAKDSKLSLDRNTEYYNNYGEVAAADFATGRGIAVTLIDNDGDGVVEVALSLEKTLSKVTSMKNDTLSVTGIKSVDAEDVVGWDDVEKDDIILYVQYGGRTYVQQPEVATGKMSSFNIKDKDNQYMTVDGEDYHDDVLEVKTITDVYKFLVEKCDNDDETGVQFEATYDLFLDDFDHVVAFRKVDGASNRYALVLDSAVSRNALTYTGEVKLLLPDGTENTYTVDISASAKNFPGANDSNRKNALYNFLGSDDSDKVTGVKASKAAGQLVSYSLDEDGKVVTIAPAELNLASAGAIVFNYSAPTAAPTATMQIAEGTELTVAKGAKLGVDLKKGNTYFTIDGGFEYIKSEKKDRETTNEAGDTRFGIDAETVVFYYWTENGSNKSAVAVGYDGMTSEILASGNVGVDAVMYNPDSNGTKVARAMVVRAKADFSNYQYALVLDSHRYDGTYRYYSAVLEDGSIVELKSKDNLNSMNGVERMIYQYSTDSKDVTTFKSVFEGPDKHSDHTYLTDENDKVYTVGCTSDTDVIYGVVTEADPFAKWIEVGDPCQETTSLGYKGTEKLWNVYDVDQGKDDEAEPEGGFQVGQQVAVVRDKNTIKAAFILADVPEDYEDTNVPANMEARLDLENNKVYVYNPQNVGDQWDIAALVKKVLEDAGVTGVKFNNAITPTNDTMTTNVTGTYRNLSLTLSVCQLYDVTYNGKSQGLFATGQDVVFTATSGHSDFLVNKTGDTTADATITPAVGGASGRYSYTVTGSETLLDTTGTANELHAQGNKTIAIVDAFSVAEQTDGNGIVLKYTQAGGTKSTITITGGNATSYIAKNTQLTVEPTAGYVLNTADATKPLNSAVTAGKLAVTKNIAATDLTTVQSRTVSYTIDPNCAYLNREDEAKYADVDVMDGADYTIVNVVPDAKSGFQFVGWSDGTDMWNPGDEITVTANVVLEAVFAAADITITTPKAATGLAAAGVKMGLNVDLTSVTNATVTVKATGTGTHAATAVPANTSGGTVTYTDPNLVIPFTGISGDLSGCTTGDSIAFSVEIKDTTSQFTKTLNFTYNYTA